MLRRFVAQVSFSGGAETRELGFFEKKVDAAVALARWYVNYKEYSRQMSDQGREEGEEDEEEEGQCSAEAEDEEEDSQFS